METTAHPEFPMSNAIVVNETSKFQLTGIIKWTRFLSIVGFVGLGIATIGVLLMLFAFPTAGSLGLGALKFLEGFFALAVFALYFFPLFWLYKSSAEMKIAIANDDQTRFNSSLSYQLKLYKFLGILTLIALVFYAIFFLFAVVMGAIMGHSASMM